MSNSEKNEEIEEKSWIIKVKLFKFLEFIIRKKEFFLEKDQKKTHYNMLFAIVIFCQPQTFEMKKWQNMNHFILLYQVSWHKISILDWDIKFYYFRDEDSKLT